MLPLNSFGKLLRLVYARQTIDCDIATLGGELFAKHLA
jgi:hypothetical protein